MRSNGEGCSKIKKLACWIFCKAIAPQVTIGFSKNSWYGESDSGKEAIFLNLNDRNPAFMKHLRKAHHFPQAYNYSEPLWTALHEIGHHFTFDYCKPTTKEPKSDKAYFNMEIEWEATEWAIAFVKSHRIICKIFSMLMTK